MVLWFRNLTILLVVYSIFAGVLTFVLLPDFAKADVISVTIQVNSTCGDNIIEASEQCEGVNLDGQTCEGLGYLSGELACYGNCNFNTSGCVPVPTPVDTTSPGTGGGGDVSLNVPLARVSLEGKAYPNAFLSVLRHGKIIHTFKVDSSGFFKKELDGLIEGSYLFGVWAEDEYERKSVTLNFPITIFSGMTATIKGIFISPTISILESAVQRGDEITVSGSAFPGADVHLFVSPGNQILKTKADLDGLWTYNFDTSLLEEGEYMVKAKSFFEETEEISFSRIVFFSVGFPPILPEELPEEPEEEPKIIKTSDFNGDGKVDLVDFSIMLFWWGEKEISHPYVDINSDEDVDIFDFSILMYWWTG